MARLLRKHGVKGARQQAAYYYAREQRRERMHPGGQFVTHQIAAGVDVDCGAAFTASMRSAPVAFDVVVKITAANPSGVVFEFGDATLGTALAFTAGGLIQFASGGPAGSGGATAVRTLALPAAHIGRTLRFTGVVAPGRGAANLWLDGALVAAAVAPAGSFAAWTSATWGSAGSVDGQGGGVTGRISAAGALTGAALVSPLHVSVFVSPRVLQVAGLGVDGGSGVWTN